MHPQTPQAAEDLGRRQSPLTVHQATLSRILYEEMHRREPKHLNVLAALLLAPDVISTARR